MKKHFRPVIKALRRWGATGIFVRQEFHKHPRIVFEWRGQIRDFGMPNSPKSSENASKWAIRNLARQLGVEHR